MQGSAVPESADELARLRRQIDAIDAAILEQLNLRARCVKRVGELKQGGRNGPIYVAARERDLVRALVAANPGPFPSAALPHVFREIISATRSLEERVRVAFLGPDGTFSHQAASRQFGAQVDLVPATTLRDVFTSTERGDTHFGVVPVENTIEGPINVTFDALVETDVTICSEIKLEIAQHLMSRSGRMEDIQRVASPPAAAGPVSPLARDEPSRRRDRRDDEHRRRPARPRRREERSPRSDPRSRPGLRSRPDRLEHPGPARQHDALPRDRPGDASALGPGPDERGLHGAPRSGRRAPRSARALRAARRQPDGRAVAFDGDPGNTSSSISDMEASSAGCERPPLEEAASVSASHKVSARSREPSKSSPGVQPSLLGCPGAKMSLADRVKPYIRSLAPYVPGKPIEELERELGSAARSSSLRTRTRSGLRRARSRRCAPPPRSTATPTARASRCAALAKKLGVAGDQLVFGAGADEILELIAKTLMGRRRGRLRMALVRDVSDHGSGHGRDRRRRPADAGSRHDLDAMLAAIGPRTRVVMLCNPTTRPGRRRRRGLRSLRGGAAGRRRARGRRSPASSSCSPAGLPDAVAPDGAAAGTVVLRTFSKIYGLAGIRISCGICDRELASYLERARHPFNVNRASPRSRRSRSKTTNTTTAARARSTRRARRLPRRGARPPRDRDLADGRELPARADRRRRLRSTALAGR
ncbi:MAG: aminotransferase class I/II-fold pyridoxal phosphate-dependent enzyme [Myxococcota bacterium]